MKSRKKKKKPTLLLDYLDKVLLQEDRHDAILCFLLPRTQDNGTEGVSSLEWRGQEGDLGERKCQDGSES